MPAISQLLAALPAHFAGVAPDYPAAKQANEAATEFSDAAMQLATAQQSWSISDATLQQ